jgi:hypothetical protein
VKRKNSISLGLISLFGESLNAQNTDPASLDRLNDIVMPPPVAWWPPAPGWYFLTAIAFLWLLVLVIGWTRRYRANRYRRAALRELSRTIDSMTVEITDSPGEVSGKTGRFLVLVAELLKRTAMTAAGRMPIAAISGKEWVQWLNDHCKQPVFTGKTAELLAQSIYQLNASPSENEVRELLSAARSWIGVHRVKEPC